MTDDAHLLQLTVDHPTVFDVRRFAIRENLHQLFHIDLEVVCADLGVELDSLVGRDAHFRLRRADGVTERSWQGLVTDCGHIGIDDDQLATYRIVVQPRLWLLTQRRNYRVFQQMSDPEVAIQVLADWGISPRRAFDVASYPARKYRVQYAESDYHFVCRLLEDAGITYAFEAVDGNTRLVLDDAPHARELRETPITYASSAIDGRRRQIAFDLRVERGLRPGRYTQRDVDYRRSPEFPLSASAQGGIEIEQSLERYHQNYGAFLFRAEADGATPVADDRGPARTRLDVGQRQVERRLAAKRADARRCLFSTTAHDLKPGDVFHLGDHPRPELAEGQRLLVVGCELEGDIIDEWSHRVDARFADQPFHPPLSTPKPRTHGVESATVVGPDDDEIHTDEFARVRVQFHWDREGKRDPQSSCWIPVSQPWGGAGFGAVNIPRVGQEVLVQFLGADPDRPVVVGRVFTKTNPVPYKLPEHKTVSGIRSRSANRMMMGANDGPGEVLPQFDLATSIAEQLSPPNFAQGPSIIQSALDGDLFNASSPDAGAHLWPGSEVTMNDRAGQEVLYMQAERDMNTVVKNNQTAVIGNRRATRVGGDDVLDVDHQQFITVGSDRLVQVEGSQRHVVTGDIVQESVEGSQHFLAKEEITTLSRLQMHVASDAIIFNVGESTLLMCPEFVILQTPKLFLNPGPEALQAAAMSGEPPLEPEEAAAVARQQATDAFNAYMDEAYANGDMVDWAGNPTGNRNRVARDAPVQVPGQESWESANAWEDARRRAYFDTWMEENNLEFLPGENSWERTYDFWNGGQTRTPVGPPPGGG